MTKGVIMEVRERDCIVLTDSGAFIRLRKHGRSFTVGAEITLPEARRALPRRSSWMLSSAAAAVLMAVFLFSALPAMVGPAAITEPAADEPVAYVTIDINPSIEFGIDNQEQVIEVNEWNEDAKTLLEGLSLVGQPLEDAVNQVMEQAEDKILEDRGEGEIVITSVILDDKAKLAEEELVARLTDEVQGVLARHHEGKLDAFHVTLWSAPGELREEAVEHGLSTGKMAFYLKAKQGGLEVTVEQLKEHSIHDLVKKNNRQELLQEDPAFTKEEIKKLLKAEKEAVKAAKEERKKSGDDEGNGPEDNGGTKTDDGNKEYDKSKGGKKEHKNEMKSQDDKADQGKPDQSDKPKMNGGREKGDKKNQADAGRHQQDQEDNHKEDRGKYKPDDGDKKVKTEQGEVKEHNDDQDRDNNDRGSGVLTEKDKAKAKEINDENSDGTGNGTNNDRSNANGNKNGNEKNNLKSNGDPQKDNGKGK